MASLTIGNIVHIEYSGVSGEIRHIELNEEVYFDKVSGIEIDGWRENLVNVIKNSGMDKLADSEMPAFFCKLRTEGILI